LKNNNHLKNWVVFGIINLMTNKEIIIWLKKIFLFIILLALFTIIFKYLFYFLEDTKFSINLTGQEYGKYECYKIAGFPFAWDIPTGESLSGNWCLAVFNPKNIEGMILNYLSWLVATLLSTIFSYKYLKKVLKIQK